VALANYHRIPALYTWREIAKAGGVGASTPVVMALQAETRTIPILFVQVIEPVAAGFVTSLARPGGNVTGITNFEFSMGGK